MMRNIFPSILQIHERKIQIQMNQQNEIDKYVKRRKQIKQNVNFQQEI